MANETCAHLYCRDGREILLDHLKDEKDMTELKCGCNHPECVAAKL
jgi:aerobic-type carbon monoxide dehydrogenase small subunit (CoxS/CutS family)